MTLQQRKQELMQSLKNKRLMENYRKNQTKHEDSLSQKLLNGSEFASSSINNLNKANSLINKFKSPSPSSVLNNPMSQGVGQMGIGNYGLGTQTFQPQSELASQIGATNIGGAAQAANAAGNASKAAGAMSKIGNAAPAIGAVTGGLSAANNFANGNTMDGALDLAKTGAMFIPGVGWAASAAIQIAQMLKGAKEKADQKAMAKSQEEAAKLQQLSVQNIQNTKQELEQQRQENLSNMQSQMQPVQSNQDMVNNMMAQYQAMSTPQTPPEGAVTGGAAPIAQNTYATENTPALPYEGSANQEIEAKTNSMMDILKSMSGKIGEGIKDFSEGYQDNSQNGFKQGDLYNQVIQNNEATPIQVTDGSVAGRVDEMKKTLMNRLGEAAGTGQRMMANPWVQAGIAAIATKATGGDGADILNNAYKYGIDKAKSNYYSKLINPNGSLNALQNYTADDYKAKLTKDNHDDTMNKWQQEQNYKREKDERDYNYKVNKDKEDRTYKNKELEMKQAYYKSRSNGDSAKRLAWQKEKDRRDNELKFAKQEFDYKNKQLSNQEDFGTREEEYQDLFGNKKTRKVPIKKDEAMQSAYDEYMQKVNGIMNGGSVYDNEQEELEAELRRRGLI